MLSKPVGEKNYADLLDEDKAIAGQKYCCLSFVSPEKIIENKHLFYFQEFVKTWDYTKNIELYNNFISFISYKYSLNNEEIQNDLKDFIKQEQQKLTKENITNDYKNFMDNNEDNLQNKYDIQNKFQTSVRGIKNRGNFATQEEAEMRAKMLRENDPSHDVYVGQVGMWMPFDPDAYKTGNVDYLESELNQLMHSKKENEEKAKEEFDDRIKETKKKAIEENQKKAKESGNTLTQILDENGELVNLSKVDYDAIPDEDVVLDPKQNPANNPSNNLGKEFMKHTNVK